MATAGSISGTVTGEPGGGPIAAVQVCQYERQGAIEESCTQTDGNGNYTFAWLPAGSYVIGFSGQPGNLEWVSEIYNDKPHAWEADLVTIGASQALDEIDAELAEGGSISGVVTDENSDNPISDIRVCAIDHAGIPNRCSDSGPNGEYLLNGLPTGSYNIEFEGGNRANYLTEYYKDAETWAAAEDVEVEAPNLTSGIDGKLAAGAQILGHVSEVSSGAPLADVMVCAEDQAGEFEACDWTGPAGDYAIRSLPAHTYLVGFGIEFLPFFGRIAAQWWQGVSAKADATPIAIAPPETRNGIDAQLINPYPKPKAENVMPPTIQPLLLPRKLPAKCRKGFHRKKVRGKSRCVRKRRRAFSHRHGGQCRSGLHHGNGLRCAGKRSGHRSWKSA